jgi:tetraacyldisaccharide-1-P 4'-kinase
MVIGISEPPEWMNLSGAELRARLEQRGINNRTAHLFDDHREYYEDEISHYLGESRNDD